MQHRAKMLTETSRLEGCLCGIARPGPFQTFSCHFRQTLTILLIVTKFWMASRFGGDSEKLC